MNISFAETKEQIKQHRKHVTRRVDKSLHLAKKKPREILQGIEKGQGIKKGEHVKKLDQIIILEVNREPLDEIIRRPYRELPKRILQQYRIPNGFGGMIPDRVCETILEGFPQLTPVRFVDLFCRINKKCTPETEITRVLFDYPCTPSEDCAYCRKPGPKECASYQAAQKETNISLNHSKYNHGKQES